MRCLMLATLVVAGAAGTCWSQNPYYRPQQVNRPAQYDPSPTVSPYLNLVPLVDGDGQVRHIEGAYQTFVRPQLEQRQAIRQQQTQISQLQHRLDRVQAPVIGQQRTGHVSRFQSFAHFYPQLNAPQRP